MVEAVHSQQRCWSGWSEIGSGSGVGGGGGGRGREGLRGAGEAGGGGAKLKK